MHSPLGTGFRHWLGTSYTQAETFDVIFACATRISFLDGVWMPPIGEEASAFLTGIQWISEASLVLKTYKQRRAMQSLRQPKFKNYTTSGICFSV